MLDHETYRSHERKMSETIVHWLSLSNLYKVKHFSCLEHDHVEILGKYAHPFPTTCWDGGYQHYM